jgi:two-component system, chemotaxis family, protein-glutamate methylesterase/glutaminase
MAQTERDKDPGLIIIGGSAGSLHVIFRLISPLTRNYKVPLLIVLHRHPQEGSRLIEVLVAKTKIPVIEVEDKESIKPGAIYVCPPDYHVLIEQNLLFSLDYSEKVNYSRPSIDVAFTAAADSLGDRITAILLSGGNADGSEGIQHVMNSGGLTIIQDPSEAEVPYMPEQALIRDERHVVMTSSEIAAYLLSFQ